MTHQCPFDHDSIPLTPEVGHFLEKALMRIVSPSGNVPDHNPLPRYSDEALMEALYRPITDLFQPWAREFQHCIQGNEEIQTRICHDGVGYIAEILERQGLGEILDQKYQEIRRENPQLSVHFSQKSLDQRVKELQVFRNKVNACQEELSRGMVRLLQRSLPAYFSRLLEAAKKYKESADRMHNAFGKTLGLWDLQPGDWLIGDATPMEKAALTLEQEPSITGMIDTLGRRAVQKYANHRNTGTEKPRELALGRQEVVGLSQGRDLESLLPYQLALLNHPAGRPKFLGDYGDHRLLQWEYRTRDRRRESEPAEVKESDLGPFVLCIDTSGSMDGRPEFIAKAISLAAIRRALASNRALVLVSFSDRTRVLHWKGGRSYGEYLQFLSHSFKGGTDLRPALDASIRVIQENDFHQGDILIVSDFRVPKIMVRKSSELQTIQTKLGTRVHGLTIGYHPIHDEFHFFDSRWFFPVDSHPFGNSLVETN